MDAVVEGLFLQDVQLEMCKFPGPIRIFCKILDVFREKLVNHFFADAAWLKQPVQVDAAYFDGPEFTLYDDLSEIFVALAPKDQSTESFSVNNDADYHLWPIRYLQEQLK